MRRLFFFLFFLSACGTDVGTTLPTEQYIDSCITEDLYEVTGWSMEPLLKAGEKVTVLIGYNNCNNLSRDDLVMYNYTGHDTPVLKRIIAVPGDSWSFNGTITVNGKIQTTTEGELYRISRERLVKYAKDYPTFEPGQYLIMGNQPSGSLDSSTFGIVHESDIIGVVKP